MGSTVLEEDKDMWLMNATLGHNTLAKFMCDISVAAFLSRQYTNYCVHVTSIVDLKSAGIEDRKICAISGHRNAQLLNAYDCPTCDEIKTPTTAVDKENASEPVSDVVCSS